MFQSKCPPLPFIQTFNQFDHESMDSGAFPKEDWDTKLGYLQRGLQNNNSSVLLLYLLIYYSIITIAICARERVVEFV